MSRRAVRERMSGQNLPVERESGLLTLVLGVKMNHAVLAVEHSKHDPKERRDHGHVLKRPLLKPT